MNENNEKVKETISEQFCYGYSDKFDFEEIDERHLYLNSEIDSGVIDNVVYHILRYNRIDKDKPVGERKPIVLYINSPGECVSDGYSLIDAIRLSKTPVYTVNLALAASMGFLVFIAGHKRYAFPHSEFLLHDGSTMGYDSTAKMRDRMEFETIELEKETRQYILGRTKIDNELYDDKYRCEWYFLPHKAKEIGAVDFIIGEDCDLDDII